MGGKNGSGATTVVEDPIPDYLKGKVAEYVGEAQMLATPKGSGGVFKEEYSEDTYAEMNDDEKNGIAALATRGKNGSAIVSRGKAILEDIATGGQLNANPKLDDYFSAKAEAIAQEFKEQTLPAIDSEALMLGMFGSSGHQIRQIKAAENAAARLAEASEGAYYDDYENSRGVQENIHGHVMVYGHEGARDAKLLQQAGLYMREYNQGKLDDAFKKWKSDQERVVTKLEILGNAIRAMIGSYASKTEPYYRPGPIGQIAGLALAGGGLFASIYSKTSPNSSQYQQPASQSMALPSSGTTTTAGNEYISKPS